MRRGRFARADIPNLGMASPSIGSKGVDLGEAGTDLVGLAVLVGVLGRDRLIDGFNAFAARAEATGFG